ncbi:TetR/AcrR family transcriptional regulator C-terminal domain-containing protein [Cystobacter ferrugineus]|uniref:TetR/AcrR family transcriptional regulator C-terminal domain-containing protein n=1 Tax=Cystobacter ferrugineus TaxID=83449 RepID=UPI001651149B
MADRLARLSLAGRLSASNPAEAAKQFIALLTGPLKTRSLLGTRHGAGPEKGHRQRLRPPMFFLSRRQVRRSRTIRSTNSAKLRSTRS